VLAASAFASAAIGFGYALLFALPELRAADAAHAGTAACGLAAAVGFASAQLVAGVLVLRAQAWFFAWLVPAALYLFAIGAIGWLRSGELEPLWLDSARGLWLLVLGAAQLRTMRARTQRSRSTRSRRPPAVDRGYSSP
jgi:hypothetical protein